MIEKTLVQGAGQVGVILVIGDDEHVDTSIRNMLCQHGSRYE
jgi:hypothetical protein